MLNLGAEEHHHRDRVSESGFVCAFGEPEAFGAGTPLHCGKQ